MKTNGRIRELLAIRCANDIEYGHRVIWPLMDYLGIPPEMRRPQFQIENPFGGGLLRLDYLIHVGDLPMVTIEGEPHATQFPQGYKQARNYSTNFKPRQRDCPMREMTVPFLIVAASDKAEMRRAVARGLTIEYEPIHVRGVPAFLEWQELLGEAAAIQPAGAVSPDQQVLIADVARQFFNDLYAAIDGVAALRCKDDLRIILFNGVIDLARGRQLGRIRTVCRRSGLNPARSPGCSTPSRGTNRRSQPTNSPGRRWHAVTATFSSNPVEWAVTNSLPVNRSTGRIASAVQCAIATSPGNDEYSGTNRDEIARQWTERFGHVDGGLMDHHCFIRRAVELVRTDGGRICMLVPEGLLARDNRGMPKLRTELMRDCELRPVISLPRVFKNNNARMAIVYLVRNPVWNADRKVLMAGVQSTWKDEAGVKHTTDLFGELETIVDRYLADLEAANSDLPPGQGLESISSVSRAEERYREVE